MSTFPSIGGAGAVNSLRPASAPSTTKGRPAVASVELHWWELRRGDRVSHFDYGTGTVDGAGPERIYITWDDPDEELHHHTSGIVRHLQLMSRPDGAKTSVVY
jgi:hypothetical protein